MKRCLLQIATFALLGAIVNVAVAWACAAFVVPKLQQPCTARIQIIAGESPVAVWLLVERASNVGVQRHVLAGSGWSPINNDGSAVRDNWVGSRPPANVGLPSWSTLGVSDDRGSLISTEIDSANGWPCAAMYGALLERHSDPNATSGWRAVFDTRSAILLKGANAGDPLVNLRALPLVPLWPGFAINTVFYAGVLWLLFAVPFALRRRRRIRRGLCPRCAYDLRGSDAAVCPECGNTVADRCVGRAAPCTELPSHAPPR